MRKLFLLCCLLPLAACQPQAPIKNEQALNNLFQKNMEVKETASLAGLISSPKLSPSGEHVAFYTNASDRGFITIRRLADGEDTAVVGYRSGQKVKSINWQDNKRLLSVISFPFPVPDDFLSNGDLYGVNIDGSNNSLIYSNFRKLDFRTGGKISKSTSTKALGQYLFNFPQEARRVLVLAFSPTRTRPGILTALEPTGIPNIRKLNTVTAVDKNFLKGPAQLANADPRSCRFLLDEMGNGVFASGRLNKTFGQDELTVFYRQQDNWVDFRDLANSKTPIDVLAATNDGKGLYYLAKNIVGDTALFKYNTEQQTNEEVFSLSGVDLQPVDFLYWQNHGALAAVVYGVDKEVRYEYFDKNYEKLHKKILNRYPTQAYAIPRSFSKDFSRVLVEVPDGNNFRVVDIK